MVKLDSFTTGAARFLSGITGAVSFWTGLAGREAAGVVVVFCLSSGLSGEAGGTIWRSVLSKVGKGSSGRPKLARKADWFLDFAALRIRRS